MNFVETILDFSYKRKTWSRIFWDFYMGYNKTLTYLLMKFLAIDINIYHMVWVVLPLNYR